MNFSCSSLRPSSLLMYILLLLGMASCEDLIMPDLEQVDALVVIDAWVNNQPEKQLIRISQTQPFFTNQLPPGVRGATVVVTDEHGGSFEFIESATTPGDYWWIPTASETLGEIGEEYTLTVQLNGQTYEAHAKVGRVPEISDITLAFEAADAFQPDSFIAEFWAIDPLGRDDTYWIKTWKNGTLLNKPVEINLAYDAGFSAGGNFDGVTFITPIRQGINPVDEDEDGELLSPYQPGDSVRVEIHSITIQAFNFLNVVKLQTDRPGGFSELFATPLSNVPTNIVNKNNADDQVLGFFNVAAVSSLEKKLHP